MKGSKKTHNYLINWFCEIIHPNKIIIFPVPRYWWQSKLVGGCLPAGATTRKDIWFFNLVGKIKKYISTTCIWWPLNLVCLKDSFPEAWTWWRWKWLQSSIRNKGITTRRTRKHQVKLHEKHIFFQSNCEGLLQWHCSLVS